MGSPAFSPLLAPPRELEAHPEWVIDTDEPGWRTVRYPGESADTRVQIVEGRLAEDQGEIDLPLICDWPNRPKQIVDFHLGKASKTRWQVLERIAETTRVELEPLTGRTHQLRVHMAAMRHAILGDRFYAPPVAQAKAKRLQLHAFQLGFAHPTTQEPLFYEADPDF